MLLILQFYIFFEKNTDPEAGIFNNLLKTLLIDPELVINYCYYNYCIEYFKSLETSP